MRAVTATILLALNARAIGSAALLRGPRAVRALEWTRDGEFHVRLGGWAAARPSKLQPASFRLGPAFLVLWFATAAGRRVVVIDGGLQDPVAFRRLTRHLARGMLIPSGPKV